MKDSKNVADSKKGLEIIASVADVSRETQDRLVHFADMLIRWQARINLIAPSTLPDLWIRHFADSAQCFALYPKARHWLDIGSGGGFPGLVIAIFLAERGTGRIDLIESSGKKCAFLNAVVRESGLREAGVEVHVWNDRIEDRLEHLPEPEVITARALAGLDDLLGLTKTFLARGSIGLFAKGRDHDAEIDQAKRNWDFDCDKSPSRYGEGSVLLQISGLKQRKSQKI